MRLKGRIAAVTGAGSTIGRAVCLEFAREGARVVVVDRDAAAEALAETVREAGGAAHFSLCDVSDEDQVQAMVGDAVMAFGGLDVLVNAAHVRLDGDAVALTPEDWRASFAANVDGVWLCARFALPFMKASKHGAVINVTLTHAERTMPRRFAQAATQSAVVGMTRSMAVDFGPHGVRANALMIGHVQSDYTERKLKESADSERDFRRILSVHPLGRIGAPEDVARAAAFLASDDAAFVTGSTLVVDGGRSCVIQDLHDWA